MRIVRSIALGLCLLFIVSGVSAWLVQPFSPCNSTLTSICNQQNNLCCQFVPPETPCNNNIGEPVQQCYNSDQYVCEQDMGITGGACLCPTGHQCCNKACFIPASGNSGYNCAVNQLPANPLQTFQLCPSNYNSCNGACYPPNSGYNCCPGPNGGGVLTFGLCLI
jgi:hypothetical protein